VQPIIGTMLGVARPRYAGGRRAPIDWLALYAQDEAGYDNLCALVSAAHLDRPLERRRRMSISRRSGRTDGLIALTAGGEGALARLLAEGQQGEARGYADRLQALFPDRLYIEMVARGSIRSRAGPRPRCSISPMRAICRSSRPTRAASPTRIFGGA
jgi:DNA polymerase-3 subunit alpha